MSPKVLKFGGMAGGSIGFSAWKPQPMMSSTTSWRAPSLW